MPITMTIPPFDKFVNLDAAACAFGVSKFLLHKAIISGNVHLIYIDTKTTPHLKRERSGDESERTKKRVKQTIY